MTWLTWRQFRVPAMAVFLALAVIGVGLAITGPVLADRTDFTDLDVLYGATVLVLYALPAVVGVFWAVPMVTRELETGTHSLVWNQTVTRGRWLSTKLGIGVSVAMAAAGLLSLAVSWWASPIDAQANEDPDGFPPRIAPLVFAVRGIVPIGYAAFAFALGLAVGIVLRRTVTAMAVTLVVFAAVQVAVPFLVRPNVIPETTELVTITDTNITEIVGNPSTGVLESMDVVEPVGAWVLTNETVDSAGEVVRPLPAAVQECLPTPGEAPPPRQAVGQCLAGLSDLGYQQRLTYHAADRFWPLQWIETGLFLALSASLAWFSFRRIRHLS